MLAGIDVSSLHAPANEQTRRCINAARLALMPRGSILINTARGSLVDEAALLDSLRSGQLAAAGLDVSANVLANLRPFHAEW